MPEDQPGPGASDFEAAKAAITTSFDRSADSYEETGVAFFGPQGAELVARAAPKPGESVLDMGCGRGHCLFPVAEAVGPAGRVVGTDLAPRMVELTAADVEARGLSAYVTVEVGDAAAPAFPPGSFDLVTAGHVMFLVPEPRPALRAVAGLLRPGGRFAMSTFGPSDPKFGKVMEILYAHYEGPPWNVPADRPFDDAASITAMLVEAGFTDVRVDEIAYDSEFSDLQHFWAWMSSHGGRILMDLLSPARLEQAKAVAMAALAEMVGDGPVVNRSVVRYTTATVPVG